MFNIFFMIIIGSVILFIFRVIFFFIFTNRDINKEFALQERGKELSKGKQDIIVLKYKDKEFLFSNGGKVVMTPIYKKKDGTYCMVEAPDSEYIGYCVTNELDRYRNKFGKVSYFDKHGNPINKVSKQTYVEEDDDTSQYSNNNYDYEDDNSSNVNHRVDWREDGSYGDIYEVGGQRTDQYGNPLY